MIRTTPGRLIPTEHPDKPHGLHTSKARDLPLNTSQDKKACDSRETEAYRNTLQ